MGKISYFWEQDIKAGNLKLKRSNPILYNNSVEYLKFYAKYELIKQYLLRKNKYFYTPSKGEKYLYMPLHLIPESTTFTLAWGHYNNLAVPFLHLAIYSLFDKNQALFHPPLLDVL